MKVRETEYEIDGKESLWLGFTYLFILLLILGFLGFMWWSEYKLEKQIIDDTHKNNGSCVRNGIYDTCSYSISSSEKTSIITPSSKCYRNDIEINCSEIK